MTTTVTAPNGQSWTFPGTVVNGTYVNGDVWVYTATTLPMPTLSTPATGSGSTARNGGMINPTFNTLVEASPMGQGVTTAMKQGYDGRIFDGATLPDDIVLYDAAYNAHVSAATLSPGDSLVSAVSLTDEEYDNFLSNHRAIGQMACLTVVDYIPETDEFRPAYFGTTKTRWRFSDLNLGLLPDLTPSADPKGVTSENWHIDEDSIYFGAADPVAGTTRAEEMRSNGLYDLQYWITPIVGSNAVSLLKPNKQMYVYPRDTGTVHGRLAAYVLHDFDDRDIFLTNLIQVAIDTFAIADGHSGRTPFSTGAGFYASPLWLIRFAGLLFDDADMMDAGSMTTGKTDYNGDPIPKWGEQTRVYYSATGYAGYLLPDGYTGDVPLYGDAPFADKSGGYGGNDTFKDVNGVYDGHSYRYGFSLIYGTSSANSADGTTIKLDVNASDVDDAYNGHPIVGTLDGSKLRSVITDYNGTTHVATVSPAFSTVPDTNDTYIIYTSTFPDILDDTYPDLQDVPILGTYAIMNNAQMGCFMASVIMDDEAFWGGAVADYNRRWANDRQMWLNWGVNFDYDSSGFDYEVQRDQMGFGGTGNGFMADLWDSIDVPVAPGTSIAASVGNFAFSGLAAALTERAAQVLRLKYRKF